MIINELVQMPHFEKKNLKKKDKHGELKKLS